MDHPNSRWESEEARLRHEEIMARWTDAVQSGRAAEFIHEMAGMSTSSNASATVEIKAIPSGS